MKKILLIAAIALSFSSLAYADRDGYREGYRGYGGGWEHHEHEHYYRPPYYQPPQTMYYAPPPVRYYQQPPVRYYQPPQVIYQQPPYYR